MRNKTPKEFRSHGFHIHVDDLPDDRSDAKIVTLSYNQTRLTERYAPEGTSGKVFRAMQETLLCAIQILHPRLPEDFFKDFSG